jgi:hypothetical protein
MSAPVHRGTDVLFSRRELVRKAGGLAVLGLSAPALLAACGGEEEEAPETGAPVASATAPAATTVEEAQEQARAVVGDVVDFALSSDQWEGDFGFVTMALHHGLVDGADVYFVRTDASDERYATAEKLVFVPKLQALLVDGLAGAAYFFDSNGQPPVLSSEPDRDDYTPAWRIHNVRFADGSRRLRSAAEIAEAEREGAIAIESTEVIVNAPLVKWSSGTLAVDRERTAYLGQGQLLEPPDTGALRVTFKLSQCFPGSRYIVTDHSIAPAAAMTSTSFAPALQGGPTEAGATGRTNVFMNGIRGPGPMGFQPSAFDFDAGAAEWSPYWDHYTYAWKNEQQARVLRSQEEVHEARDAGELEEFPGTPDTNGEVFTVNCPVPVLAPVTFSA